MVSTALAKQLVRKVLLDSSAVQALVDGHVYGAHPQDPDASAIPMPCLIVDLQGGDANYCGGIQRLSGYVYAYSRQSQDEADATYQAAYEALHAQQLVDTTTLAGGAKANPQVGGARETGRPVSGWNEGISAWFARGTWEVITAG